MNSLATVILRSTRSLLLFITNVHHVNDPSDKSVEQGMFLRLFLARLNNLFLHTSPNVVGTKSWADQLLVQQIIQQPFVEQEHDAVIGLGRLEPDVK